MNLFNFLILFFCCAKKPISNIDRASAKFSNKDCVTELKFLMKAKGCDRLSYSHQKDNAILFRCYKPDSERGVFWDNYIFRMSPSKLKYSEEDHKLVDLHTICNDGVTRVEAYPPNFKGKRE